MQTHSPHTPRSCYPLYMQDQPTLVLQTQAPKKDAVEQAVAACDVVYVHGSTFGADMSIFYRFDGRSWADALNEAGFTAWGFDWAGYGHSQRYPHEGEKPVGRLHDVLPQLQRVVAAVRAGNGNRPVALLGHSWGATVAAAYAVKHADDVCALTLFGPIAPRASSLLPSAAAVPPPRHYLTTLWAQYRRFVEDVPRGQAQVLSESHFEAWGRDYLATDPHANDRQPPAVLTPGGPMADIRDWWSGQWPFEPANLVAPTLLVRGAWDSLSTDADAAVLLGALTNAQTTDRVIERATHLMHLESQRGLLYQRVNEFLLSTLEPV